MEAVGFRLKGKCKRNESLRVNGGRPVARTPVGDKPRRIPRSQQCANRHHATRLLRRRDLPFRVYYPQFFQISIYIYIHVFLTPLYLHCIYFRAPTLSIHFEKHSRTRELADPTFRFFPRFFIPRSNNRSINRIDRIIRYSIIIVSRLKCDHEVSRCFSSAVELGKNWLHEAE